MTLLKSGTDINAKLARFLFTKTPISLSHCSLFTAYTSLFTAMEALVGSPICTSIEVGCGVERKTLTGLPPRIDSDSPSRVHQASDR